MTKQNPASVYTITLTAAMTALICVVAPLSVPLPISPVPLSLATLIIMLEGSLLGWKLGGISCLLYLVLGTIGLPVFSGYGSGIGKLAGPTGGYLLGYLPLCILSGLIAEKCENRILQGGLLILANILVIYLPGTLWLAFQAGLVFSQALFMGVVPYIPGDLLKVVFVCISTEPIRWALLRAGVPLKK